VTDVARDFVDWIALGLTTVSTVIGAVAIIVALIADRHAKDADRKAIERSTTERHRVFELGILRDILEVVDAPGVFHQLVQHPTNVSTMLGGRLSMLPREELQDWHLMMEADLEEIRRRFGDAANDWDWPTYPSAEALTAIRTALLAEIESAVKRRMEPP
jgi:hypothetical protein